MSRRNQQQQQQQQRGGKRRPQPQPQQEPHPAYFEMVEEAARNDPSRRWSRDELFDFMQGKYGGTLPKTFPRFMNAVLTNFVRSGRLLEEEDHRYRLNPDERMRHHHRDRLHPAAGDRGYGYGEAGGHRGQDIAERRRKQYDEDDDQSEEDRTEEEEAAASTHAGRKRGRQPLARPEDQGRRRRRDNDDDQTESDRGGDEGRRLTPRQRAGQKGGRRTAELARERGRRRQQQQQQQQHEDDEETGSGDHSEENAQEEEGEPKWKRLRRERGQVYPGYGTRTPGARNTTRTSGRY